MMPKTLPPCENILSEDRTKILRLHELGFTQRQIAKSLKVSLTFVSGVLCHDYGRYQQRCLHSDSRGGGILRFVDCGWCSVWRSESAWLVSRLCWLP